MPQPGDGVEHAGVWHRDIQVTSTARADVGRRVPELTIVSLPDEMLLLVIRACNEPIPVSNGLPLFEHVKGLACLSLSALSKALQQQLHRLQPLVPDKMLL